METSYFKLKNQIKNCLVLILLFNYCSVKSTLAQPKLRFTLAQPSHEFSIYGGGGSSSLHYQIPSGNVSGGYGGYFGLGYTCIFIDSWGIHTGAALGLYGAKVSLDGVEIITTSLVDSDDDLFNLHTTLTAYNETQKAMYLTIPVMVQYQRKKSKGFYVMGGVKTGVPLSGKYSLSGKTLTNKGYYPKFGNWATEQEFAGYGVFDEKSFDGRLKFDVSLILALEAGMKFSIGRELSLYAGAYFDFGLNNVAKNSHLPFIAYSSDNASGFNASSVLESLGEKVNMMAVGVKLRLALKTIM